MIDMNNYIKLKTKIENNLTPGLGYVLYIKLKFTGKIYKMACKQFAFTFSHYDEGNIKALYRVVNILIDNIMDEYGFTNYPDSILFVFKLVDGKVNPIILRNLLLNKPKVANTKLYNFDKPLPLTLNHSKYGVLLQAIFSRENVISHFIKPNYLGEEIVFTDFGDKYLYQVKTLGLKPVDILQFKSNGLYYLKDNILVYIVKEGNK